LKSAGYAAAGYSANFLVGPATGLHQGFDEFRAFPPQTIEGRPQAFRFPPRTDFIAEKALEWLAQAGGAAKPWFLYLQLMEPHSPYEPVEGVLRRLRNGIEMPDVASVNSYFFVGKKRPLPENVMTDVRDVYDAEVGSVDLRLRAFFDQLEARGLLENTIVVVTADHGEELKDHGFTGHGHTLYEELVHVPLIIVTPAVRERMEIGETVSLVDVAPTLLDLAGVAPAPTFEGRSLRRLMIQETPAPGDRGGGAAHPSATTEHIVSPEETGRRLVPHERAVISFPYKMIAGVAGERQFFDLNADPAEKTPDALSAATRAELEAELEDFRRRFAQRAVPRARRTLTAEERDRMRALGYE
jgi:arylsulfatase A-like enzyme